jgi:hypothetical protein
MLMSCGTCRVAQLVHHAHCVLCFDATEASAVPSGVSAVYCCTALLWLKLPWHQDQKQADFKQRPLQLPTQGVVTDIKQSANAAQESFAGELECKMRIRSHALLRTVCRSPIATSAQPAHGAAL